MAVAREVQQQQEPIQVLSEKTVAVVDRTRGTDLDRVHIRQGGENIRGAIAMTATEMEAEIKTGIETTIETIEIGETSGNEAILRTMIVTSVVERRERAYANSLVVAFYRMTYFHCIPRSVAVLWCLV